MTRSVSTLLAAWFRVALWVRVMAGLTLGVGLGWCSPDAAAALAPIGELFLRAIRMIVVPLVLAMIVTGVASLGDVRRAGTLGVRALAFYVATTCAAILIGLAGGALLQPGVGVSLPGDPAPPKSDVPTPGLAERLVDMVPLNPFASLVEGNMLQIIVLGALIGAGVLMAGRRGKPLAIGMRSLGDVMLQITRIVMEFAPFGVLALMAAAVADNGVTTMGALTKLVGGYFVCCLAHLTLVYGAVLAGLLRLPLGPFARGVLDAQGIAASTTSSSATLPATMACVQQNLGVGRTTAGFVLPLGATINMDGTGVYLGVIAMFAAQAAGVSLGLADGVTLLVTATLASIGAVGVPGGSLLMVTTVLVTLGLPLEVFALVASVDRLIDIARTVVNVTGDAVAAVYVAKLTGDLDEGVYREEPLT